MAKIMIVDDEEHILLLYSEELKEQGYEVVTSNSSYRLAERIEHERPHLVILDIHMIDHDGLDLLQDKVHLILENQQQLAQSGIAARVVSMPSWEIFREQSSDYRNEVLPLGVRARLAVEAGSPLGWREWVGDTGDIVATTKFGASAPAKEMFNHYGLSVEHIVERAQQMVAHKHT